MEEAEGRSSTWARQQAGAWRRGVGGGGWGGGGEGPEMEESCQEPGRLRGRWTATVQKGGMGAVRWREIQRQGYGLGDPATQR